MRRPIIVTIVSASLLATLSVPLAAAERAGTAQPDGEQQLLERINDERTSRGKSALRWHSQAAGVARNHSHEMAADGTIYHNDDLPHQVSGWSSLAENVGMGPSIAAIHSAFMGSSGHRANVLGDFTHVGVGVVLYDGTLFVTEVFLTASSSGGSSGGGSGGSSGGSSSSGSSTGSDTGSTDETVRKRRTAVKRSSVPVPAPPEAHLGSPAGAGFEAASSGDPQRVTSPDELMRATRTVAALERFAGDGFPAEVACSPGRPC